MAGMFTRILKKYSSPRKKAQPSSPYHNANGKSAAVSPGMFCGSSNFSQLSISIVLADNGWIIILWWSVPLIISHLLADELSSSVWLFCLSVQILIPSQTSQWWKWCQRMRYQRLTIRLLNSLPSEYKTCRWQNAVDTPTHTKQHLVCFFLSKQCKAQSNTHITDNRQVCECSGANLSLSLCCSVVNWIKQIVPQPILLPPGSVPIEPSTKSSRSSLDKSTNTHDRIFCPNAQ